MLRRQERYLEDRKRVTELLGDKSRHQHHRGGDKAEHEARGPLVVVAAPGDEQHEGRRGGHDEESSQHIQRKALSTRLEFLGGEPEEDHHETCDGQIHVEDPTPRCIIDNYTPNQRTRHGLFVHPKNDA